MGLCISFLQYGKRPRTARTVRPGRPLPLEVPTPVEGRTEEGLIGSFQRVNADTAALGGQVKFVEETLAEVSVKLPARAVQLHGITSETQDLCESWRDIRDAYQQLIWNSRELAGEAQALISDFVQVFLPRLMDQDVSSTIMLDELKDYSMTFSEHAAKPKRMIASMTDFTTRVVSCRDALGDLIAKKTVAKKYTALYSAFSAIITDLTIETSQKNIFDDKGSHFVVTCFLAQKTSTFPAHFPSYLLLNDMTTDAPFTGKQVMRLSLRILAISSVSIAIRTDLMRLATYMESQATTFQDNFKLRSLHDQLEPVSNFYNLLIKALEQYQIAVIPYKLPTYQA